MIELYAFKFHGRMCYMQCHAYAAVRWLARHERPLYKVNVKLKHVDCVVHVRSPFPYED